MTNKNPLQIKRGSKVNLPTLKIGEPAFCLDTEELYIGTENGNILINDSNESRVFEKTITVNEWVKRPNSDFFECLIVHDLEEFDLDVIAKETHTNQKLFIAWSLIDLNTMKIITDENIDTKVVIKVIK